MKTIQQTILRPQTTSEGGDFDLGTVFRIDLPLTPAERVEQLIALIHASDLQHKQPLLATLNAALASIQRGNCHSAVGELGAFKNKVQAQVSPADPVLATELIEGAGQVIAALAGDGTGCLTIQFHELKRHPDGKTHLKFHAPPGRAYLVEGTTNLRDWSPLGAATARADGEFEFKDRGTAPPKPVLSGGGIKMSICAQSRTDYVGSECSLSEACVWLQHPAPHALPDFDRQIPAYQSQKT